MISTTKFKDFEDAYDLLLKYNRASKEINDLLGYSVYSTKLDILKKRISCVSVFDDYYSTGDLPKTILTENNMKKFIES